MWNFWIKLKRSIICKKHYSAALIFCLPTLLLAGPNTLPIAVHSDMAEVDAQAGIATHWGGVEMTQGDRRILGDKLIVQRNQNGLLDSMVTLGHPARYEGHIDSTHPLIMGHADRIYYFPQEQRILLEGNARLEQDGDAFEGPEITYDIERKTVISEPNPEGRTTIVIQPR